MSINNAGEITGASRPFSFIGGYAFVYKNGQYTLLPTSDEAAAYGISNAGDVVVYDLIGSTTTYLIANGVRSNLPPVIPHEITFGGIGGGLNDFDQIVGSYYNGQGS